MRNIIILLLLVIFFLSGLVFGMQKNGISEQAATSEVPAVEVMEAEEEEKSEQEEQVVIAETDVLEEGNYSLTNRMAATMEGVVKQLFEVIVSIMYGIGQLFF
ncbi:hypothetical protein [Oceanobacillus sp. J11TS1]|uniref:hypothetical protein n=1 Tax=Oceanobacillus sp. J11TS1 TaxID=2807191 RepID=UPI001B0F69F8|nr:hypothetical protein [Oceanobacillus sp. J11TS1]GIO22072.1 hypothetical protein J11TS1_06530 [Oceanobacillus sp. J11TS1]